MAEYIEREAFKRRIMAITDSPNDQFSAGSVVNLINHEPAADVEPVRHGKWIWNMGDLYMCTACNADCHVDECMNEPQYEYCPNCGAKMDLEE